MSRLPFDWTEDVQRLGERFDDFFDQLVHFTGPRNALQGTWRPAVDVFEVESGFLFVIELSGVEESDLEVNVEGGRLYVRGTRRPPQIESCDGPLQLEIQYGRFERVFALPGEVDADAIAAHLRQGVLSVRVPRPRKQVTISTRPEGKTTK